MLIRHGRMTLTEVRAMPPEETLFWMNKLTDVLKSEVPKGQ